LTNYVRVASITFGGAGRKGTVHETIESNVKAIMHLLRKAALEKPDIICLPECSPFLSLSIKEMVDNAEEIPGLLLSEVTRFARENKTYVVFPMMRKENGKVFNSAVLISRDGEYIGSYNKVHPTIWELEAGVTPGVEAKTFDLDFGKVGFAICFDLNFEDVMKKLANDNIKLIFFPSMYLGGLQLKMWAFNCGAYVISSTTTEGSMIVNPLGRILAVSNKYQPIICRDINLDYEVLHLDYNSEKLEAIKEKYGSKINFEVAQSEGVFLMSSETKDVAVKDVVEEFSLETRRKYFERALKIREKSLKF
jgi:predicted amidohydrolase